MIESTRIINLRSGGVGAHLSVTLSVNVDPLHWNSNSHRTAEATLIRDIVDLLDDYEGRVDSAGLGLPSPPPQQSELSTETGSGPKEGAK